VMISHLRVEGNQTCDRKAWAVANGFRMDQFATIANSYFGFLAEPLRGGAVMSRNGPLKLRA
jgi:hypothetical protein